MKEEYKGYEIRYLEYIEKFRAEIGESFYENTSLKKVKTYIDKLDKKDFERIDVLVDSWRDNFDSAVVTSEVPHERGVEVWVTFKEDKKRQKFSYRHVFLDNKNNRKTIDAINKCQKEVRLLENKNQELRKQLEKYIPVERRSK